MGPELRRLALARLGHQQRLGGNRPHGRGHLSALCPLSLEGWCPSPRLSFSPHSSLSVWGERKEPDAEALSQGVG